MRAIAPHEEPSTRTEHELSPLKCLPSRRDCYGVMLAILAVCSIAPFRGITFVLLGVSAVESPNLPLGLRLVALSASFCLVGTGIFGILNSG